MIGEHDMKRVATQVGTEANAERVILFGSHARGDAKENSDVDFMIIAESKLPRFKRSRELYKLFRPYPFAMDLGLARPASQGFSRWRNQESSFDELQAEIDAKGWLEARFFHQQG